MEFKKEHKYVVVKKRDAFAYLTEAEQETLDNLVRKVYIGRSCAGKSELECVVVEHDWPMYEDIWKAIEQYVVTGEYNAGAASKRVQGIDTDEVLQHIKEAGYYDDFIEMMDKDCFVEAATVFGKAETDLQKLKEEK